MIACRSVFLFAASLFAAFAIHPDFGFGQNASPVSPDRKIPDAIYSRAVQAVVRVSAGENQTAGAGIVIGKTRNGLPVILTANTLINGREDKIMIQTAEQGQAAPGRLISGKWRNRDLALLAARKPLPVAAALPYGQSDQLVPGEDAAVLGFPQSNFLAQNSGQIVRNEAHQLLLNFVMSEGQTGGPVLDQNGRIVGIAVSRPRELSQAIPIDLARITLEQWLGKTQLMEPWQEGKPANHWQGWMVAAALLLATGVAVGVSGVF